MSSLMLLLLTACASTTYDDSNNERRNPPSEVIKLIRDAKGIPHIYATTDAGAIYGAGYAAAEDRLFQMHLARMKYKGRLAEIFGRSVTNNEGKVKDIVAMDRKNRTYGFEPHMKDVVSSLDTEMVTLLQAYSDGVNDAVADMDRLPVVFGDLNITSFERWEPSDSLLSYLITAAIFTNDALSEAKGQSDFDDDAKIECGKRPTEDCLDEVKDRWLDIIIDDDAAVIPEPERGAMRSPGMGLIPKNTTASHAWAITGAHTTTGKPYLNGRPVIRPRDRSFYHSHVKGATFDVQGVGVPGLFGYLIGATQHTAWSITSMTADNSDLYRLERGSKPDTFIFNGVERPLQVRTETIIIKGEAQPETLIVRDTPYGPIVNDLLNSEWIDDTKWYAQRYIITVKTADRVHPVQGLLGIMRADHWDTFRDNGINYWSYPNANLLYADDGTRGPVRRAEGNICYRPATVVPIRSDNASLYGVLPQDVAGADDLWTGYMGVETIPEICNPNKGFLVSANHLPIGSWWGHYGIGGSGDTNRSWHIKKDLQAMIDNGPIDPAANEAYHRDDRESHILAFREVAHWYEARPEFGSFNKRAQFALQILNQWSGISRLDEPEYRIIAWENPPMKARPVASEFSRNMKEAYGTRDSGLMLFLKRFTVDPESAFVVTLDNGEVLDLHDNGFQWVERALTRYWNEATDSTSPAQCPSDPMACLLPNQTLRTVKYGTYLTTFGDWPLGDHYNLEVEVNGAFGLDTVWSIEGNTYAQAVQLGNPDATQTIVGVGNADDPGSPYFDNTLEDWADGELYDTPFSQTLVEANALDSKSLYYRP